MDRAPGRRGARPGGDPGRRAGERLRAAAGRPAGARPMSGSGQGAREGAVEVGDTASEGWPDGSFDATARVVDARLDDHDDPDERQVEVALRPKRLDDFPGQDRVRE